MVGAHPDGRQAIELYSFGPETIYQDFETIPGDVLTYSFYHLVNLNTFKIPQITHNTVTRFEIAGIEPSINMGTGNVLDAISVQAS